MSRRTGGGGNERPVTDDETSGPMKGLEKQCTRWRKHTSEHGNSMTESAQWAQVSEKKEKNLFSSQTTAAEVIGSI